ncbi:MAG: DUF3828 domain-containing protein, partial [Anaerolineales bacterium]|nr:DUF3828 domain-containing protein [Anaerolineales bacterium]
SLFSFNFFGTKMYTTSKNVKASSQFTPEKVVEAFYAEYLAYQGNPLVDHKYRTGEYLSPDLITFLDDFTGRDGMAYDPVLCAQDKPTEITAYPAQVKGNKAIVELTTNFANHKLTVELVQTEGTWQIDEIICNP